MFEIVSREGDTYAMSGPDAYEFYVRNPDYFTKKNYRWYGYQLWRTRRVKKGFNVKLRFWFRDWAWKPHFGWRYDKHFIWLFFSIRIEWEYGSVLDEIIMDHLAESKTEENDA